VIEKAVGVGVGVGVGLGVGTNGAGGMDATPPPPPQPASETAMAVNDANLNFLPLVMSSFLVDVQKIATSAWTVI